MENNIRLYKTKTVKLPIANKKSKTLSFKKHKVIGIERILIDSTGIAYQVFAKDIINYYMDFRVNNPNIGVLVNNVFWTIGTVETNLVELSEKFKGINAIELADSYLQPFKLEVNNEKD